MAGNTEVKLAVLETKMGMVEEKLKTVETKVDHLPSEVVRLLDDKYSKREATDTRLKEIEETIAPLTSIRRRIWAAIVAFTVGIAAIEAVAFYIIKQWLDQ